MHEVRTARRSSLRRQMLLVAAGPLLVALAMLGAIGTSLVRNVLDGRAYQRLVPGESEQDVEAAMGPPDVARPCGHELSWGDQPRGPNDGRCVTEVRYEHFLSAWTVGYSADGHVVAKSHGASR